MPDTEISKLPPLAAVQLQADDVLAIADVSAVETKKVRADDLVVAALERIPDGTVDPNKLNWSILDSDSISGDDLADGSIADEKLIANTLTARVIAPNAIGASELADSSVDTAAIQIGAVDNGALGTNSVDDRVIQVDGVSNANLSAGSVTVDKLSLNDDDLPGSVIAGGTITPEELEPNLSGNEILDNLSIGTDLLEDGAVVNAKLAINSVDTVNLIDNAVTAAKISSVDGSAIIDRTVTATKIEAASVGRGLDVTDTNIGITNSVAAGLRNGIEWDAQGLIIDNSALVAADIPISTDSTVGGVSVPADGGLSVTGTGALSINNAIVAGSVSGITYDQHGSITNAVRLLAADLPEAKTNEIGAVSVPDTNDSPLLIAADGALTHRLVTGGSATGLASVDIDDYGLVVSGSSVLVPSQVPGLDASKINTGDFGTARIANDAITRDKLANYSVSFIQEAEPTNIAGVHIGMGWFQESTGQLRMWNGNSWFPVGFGRLAQENLRFCGTINADTGLITTLNDSGRTAGFTAGEALPVAADAIGGTYLVVETAGSNIGVVPATAFDEGDWVLCIDQASGWIRIDTASGAGGGSALLRLNDLLDVDINSPTAGDALFYNPNTNNWVNSTTETTRITINEAFDGSTTSFTLQRVVNSVNATTLVLSGVLQEPGVDYNVVAGTQDLTFSSPPPAGSEYFMLSQATQTGSGGGGGGTSLPPGTAENEYLQWNNALGAWAPSTELSGGTY